MWLLVWRLELLLSTEGLSDPLALWTCGPSAFISLHGHHAHLGLAAGMNFVAGNSAMLGVQSWDGNGMEQEKTWCFSPCAASVSYTDVCRDSM